MNEDFFSGKWHQLKGKVKEKWGKLTDDDLAHINGKREQLLGSLKEKYGWDKHQAEEELKRFEDRCRACCSKEGKDPKSCSKCGCGADKCHCNKDSKSSSKATCAKCGCEKGKCSCTEENRWDDKSKKRKAG